MQRWAEGVGPGGGSGRRQRMRVRVWNMRVRMWVRSLQVRPEDAKWAEDTDAVHGCDHIAGSNECGPDGDETLVKSHSTGQGARHRIGGWLG